DRESRGGQAAAEVGDERRDARNFVHDNYSRSGAAAVHRARDSVVGEAGLGESVERWCHRRRLEARELVAQRAEAHAAQIEGVAVEPLQVEVASVPALGI